MGFGPHLVKNPCEALFAHNVCFSPRVSELLKERHGMYRLVDPATQTAEYDDWELWLSWQSLIEY